MKTLCHRLLLLGSLCCLLSCADTSSKSEPYFNQGTTLLQEGKWADSVGKFRMAIRINAQHAGAHVNLGCALALLGQVEEASKIFKQALSLADKEDRSFIYFNLGGLYFKEFTLKKEKSLVEQATTHFRKASELLPHWLLAFDEANHTGLFLEMFNKMNAPIHSYIMTIDEIGLPPDSTRFFSAENFMGKEDAARGRYCQFDEHAPPMLYFYRSPSTYLIRANQGMAQQRPPGAERLNLQALELLQQEAPSYFNACTQWHAYYELANITSTRDDWDRVLEYLHKAQELKVKFASEDILNALLVAYVEKRDYASAKSTAGELLQIAPTDSFAQKIMKLEWESPRVSAEGIYTDIEYGLQIKKPDQWLVFDQNTNSEEFLAEKKNHDAHIVVIFQESPLAKSELLVITVEEAPEDIRTEEDLLASVNSYLVANFSQPGNARIFELEGRRLVSYSATVMDKKTKEKTSSTYCYFLKHPQYYVLHFQVPYEHEADYASLIKETTASLVIP